MNDENTKATETTNSAASALSAGLEPASRCPDFDGDCAGVVNHLQCWRGLKSERAGVVYFTGPADGYCPFVIGMKPKGSNVQIEPPSRLLAEVGSNAGLGLGATERTKT